MVSRGTHFLRICSVSRDEHANMGEGSAKPLTAGSIPADASAFLADQRVADHHLTTISYGGGE